MSNDFKWGSLIFAHDAETQITHTLRRETKLSPPSGRGRLRTDGVQEWMGRFTCLWIDRGRHAEAVLPVSVRQAKESEYV